MSSLVSLPTVSNDLISSVKFNSTNNILSAASWDGKLTFYNVKNAHLQALSATRPSNPKLETETRCDKTVILKALNTGSSILDSCWDCHSEQSIYTGNINGHIYRYNLTKALEAGLTEENDMEFLESVSNAAKLGIQSIKINPKNGILAAISWDKKLQIIDTRNVNPLIFDRSADETQEENKENIQRSLLGDNPHESILVKNLPEKPFALDLNDNYVIVSMAKNKVYLYDLTSRSAPLVQERHSGLSWQTRDIKLSQKPKPVCMDSGKNEDFFVQSSYEGRIIVDYVDPDPAKQEKNFAFKCHRTKTTDGIDLVYPINSIVLFKRSTEPVNNDSNGVHDLLYTGGSDGIINLWDLNKRKKLKKLKKFSQSVLQISIGNSRLDENGLTDNSEHILAIVTGDDGFKNNRYLDNGLKDTSITSDVNEGIGAASAASGMANVVDFNTSLYLRFP